MPVIFEKKKTSANKRLRRSISLSISILSCTYFHCNTIHLPMCYQFTADLLPLFFQFNSSILFCTFSGLVNAKASLHKAGLPSFGFCNTLCLAYHPALALHLRSYYPLQSIGISVIGNTAVHSSDNLSMQAKNPS